MNNLSLTTTNTTASSLTSDPIPTSRVIVCSILFLLILLTIIGNVMVLVAPCYDKRLRNTFIFFVLNLALTDLGVALTAMWFYTVDVLLGYWPFGKVLCGIWIFFDYGMTFASVFTLLLISLDRLWSVTWAMHYRIHNTRKKSAIMITAVWLAMVAVWLAPCILDRVKHGDVDPTVCMWEPSRNPEFVVFIAVVGHHVPCAVMLACYVKVYAAMRRRNNVIRPKLTARHGASTTVETVEASVDFTSQSKQPKSSASQSQNAARASKNASSADKERKIFVTLTYIIVSYLLCWVPFHVVFDISALRPDLVPDVVFSITFYLTYLNSTLNPILYAFSSAEFRAAFKKAVLCQKA